jgi:tocopherol O-methyltransferase
MGAHNGKEKIIEHYDFVSPFYHELWGEHLHHGYWKTGSETKEQAQEALVEYLAQAAHLQPGRRILDVGCGFGASSIYLANRYAAETTGITISPVQVTMARRAAEGVGANARFLLMDAQAMTLNETFDMIFSIESISHYQNKGAFFRKAAELLKDHGTLAIVDWFKKDGLSASQYEKYIASIERGMLCELHPMSDYLSLLEANGLRIDKTENLSAHTAKTWDLASDIIRNGSLWKIARDHGPELVQFLGSFRAMKAGYASGAFVYGMIVSTKV